MTRRPPPGRDLAPRPAPEPLIVDGDPLHAQALLDRFGLAAQAPTAGRGRLGRHRLAVACHHAAFDGLSLVALLASLTGVVDNRRHLPDRSATLPLHEGLNPRVRGWRPPLGWGSPCRGSPERNWPRGRGPGRALPEVRGLVGPVGSAG